MKKAIETIDLAKLNHVLGGCGQQRGGGGQQQEQGKKGRGGGQGQGQGQQPGGPGGM